MKFTTWQPKKEATKIKAKAAVYDPLPDLISHLKRLALGPATLCAIFGTLTEDAFLDIRAEFVDRRTEFNELRDLAVRGGSLRGLTTEDADLAMALTPLSLMEMVDALRAA